MRKKGVLHNIWWNG